MLKKVGLALGAIVAFLVVGGFATLSWAKSAGMTRLAVKREVHSVDFPIPFPLSAAEVAALRDEKLTALGADGGVDSDLLVGVDLEAIATERAIARGKHLAEARYACLECHGTNFGGGTMIDAPPMGVLKGKNLTRGQGGVTATYKASDWDRIVRHGIKPDGTTAVMPSEDYGSMSDRELSDLVSYIRSLPPVDATISDPTFGPIGAMLMATGKFRVSAEHLPHQQPHPVEPPNEASPEFGKHLLAVCTGCHNAEFTGGPIVGGDPSWPQARNLTPHADGLAGWSYDDFVRAMREGKRKSGEDMKAPMANMSAYAKNITDLEMKAMWATLQALPAKQSPKP